jgi:glyoxylase-like metal-dependent hydrolase (beta-lactamase superfamily II)
MDAGARLHAHTLTAAAASAAGLPVIPGNFHERLTVAIDGAAVEAFYPGPGHTADNVVVQVLGTDLLFGGCMIRPLESGSAGNTADADLAAWPGSVARTAEAYPHVRRVIPSHGAPAGRELFDHTIAVVSAAQ